MIWILARHHRVSGLRRLLLDLRTGGRTAGATERHRGTLREALTAYATLIEGNVGERAGLAYVVPDLGRNPHNAPRQVIYFSTPPRVGLSAYMHEQLGLPELSPVLPPGLAVQTGPVLPAGLAASDPPDDLHAEDLSGAEDAIPSAEIADAPDTGEES
jgi:hypothetical protein